MCGPGKIITPETLTQRIKLLRQAIDDDSSKPRYIGAVRGEGYRLLVDPEKLPGETHEDLPVLRSIAGIIRHKPLASLAVSTGAIAAIAIVLVILQRQADPPLPQRNPALLDTRVENSVAVMPFSECRLGDRQMHTSSKALGDELRDQFGRVEGNQGRGTGPRPSCSGRRPTDATTISNRLGVEKLIEGTLRRTGDELRITVQIIDGRTGLQDWSGSFSRSMGNLLALQQDIASDVVRQIGPQLDETHETPAPATLNATAHDLMLLARHYIQEVTAAAVVDLERLQQAIEYLRQATELDPDSAIAHSRLGAALLYLGDVDAAEEPILTSLSLDENQSEVQNTLGLYYWIRFMPGSGEAHRRAVELNPNNADALEKYGKWLWHQQITDDVEPYFLKARDLDPMNLSRYLDLGHFYGISNRLDEARSVTEQIRDRFSGVDAYMALARIHELMGELDVGIAWALKAREADPGNQEASWQVAELYARLGDLESAQRFEDIDSSFGVLYWARRYEDMIELGEELVFDQPNQIQIWYGLARAYAATGRYDQAIYVLQANGLPENALVDARRANGLEALTTLADVLYQSGEFERAREHAAWLNEHFSLLSETGAGDSWWPNLYQACTLAILGEEQQAIEVLERVENSIGLLWYPVLVDAPCFQRFATDPRYQTIVENYEDRLASLRARLPVALARIGALN